MIDMLFVFGGDGTVLRALDMYVDRDIPILGINLGRLGFLLETRRRNCRMRWICSCAAEYAIERLHDAQGGGHVQSESPFPHMQPTK